MKAAIRNGLSEAITAGRPVAVVTSLPDGRQALVGGQTHEGDLPLSAEALDRVRQMLKGDRSGLVEADDSRLFVRVYATPWRLFVIGAVHIAQCLVDMAAPTDFAVTVIDPRTAFATGPRFPGRRLVTEWPDDALARERLDERSAVVTLSHDPKLDDPALEAALASPAFYIGALGSRRTHAKRIERLKEKGFDEAALARIHAPIGLDLGGRAPAEIALAILAQVVQARYRGAAE